MSLKITNSSLLPNNAASVGLSIDSNSNLVFAPTSFIVEQRNGTNPEVFNVYNTWTDASNYERVTLAWASNAANLTVQTAGTGTTTRNLNLVTVGAGSIQFFTQNTARWLVGGGSGTFFCATDGAFDMGGSASLRPRNIYLTGAIGVKVKAGVPVDGDFNVPVDGFLCVDSTDNKIYTRIGGVWKGVVVA